MEKQTFIYNAKGDVILTSITSPFATSSLAQATATLTFNADGTWVAGVSPTGSGAGSGNYLSGGTLGSYFRLKYTASVLPVEQAGDFSVSNGLAENVWHTLSAPITFTCVNSDFNGTFGGASGLETDVNLTITVEKISNPANTASVLTGLSAGGGCISSDTMVLLSDGTYKSAGTLTLTDTLTSFTVNGMIDTDQPNWNTWTTTDISTRSEVTSGIVALNTFTKPSYVLINNNFKTTTSHTNFICRSGTYQWCSSNQVLVGDSFVQRDGTLLPITDVQTINAEQEFTFINVETVDTFFVSVGGNTFVTHNAS